jgi:hypothetical protein
MGSDRITPGPVAQDVALDLLRAYEPVLRFTKGELFLPTAVGPYVAHCSLWGVDNEAEPRCIVPAGELSLQRLYEEAVVHRDQRLSLRFVQEPLRRAEYRRWRTASRARLSATTRFTTTGMFGRLVDAGFRATLLLRGKVAAGLAAAAEVMYREQLEADRFTYYGRVVRDGGYVCLQYWFFYVMNDWRSTFSGVNDHEADWELVTVYLAEQEDAPSRPGWVACSSHDHHGADLRRRWDDPELRRQDDHPIVFPGAGSHSGAFAPGDYVISVDPPELRKPIALARRLQRLLAPWRDETRPATGFGIPFVDYARGDGKAIGPGEEAHWTAAVIDEQTPWVRDYQGLWGLDTKDPFGGERAPSGPRYERDGSVRPAWANPLGWAGLVTVPPRDDDFKTLLAERIAALELELAGLDEAIAGERSTLRGLRSQVRSLQTDDHARGLAEDRLRELTTREAELNQMIAGRTRLAEESRTHLATLRRPLAPEAPQAHIKTLHGPRSGEQERRTRFLRVWGVVSTPLLLACVIVVLLAQPLAWITTIVVIGGIFVGVEAFARRRLWSFVASTVLLAAAIVGCGVFVVLFSQHWRIALSVIFGAAALALLIGNLGDVRHAWGRRGAGPEDQR